jgi:hypothetical protein
VTATHHDPATDTTTGASGADIDLRDGSGTTGCVDRPAIAGTAADRDDVRGRWTLLGSAARLT